MGKKPVMAVRIGDLSDHLRTIIGEAEVNDILRHIGRPELVGDGYASAFVSTVSGEYYQVWIAQSNEPKQYQLARGVL